MICIIIVSVLFIKECSNSVKLAEQIFDRTHEEIEDTLTNLISVYTSNKNRSRKG